MHTFNNSFSLCHTVLRKETPQGSIGTVVPDHKELKRGTLKGILRK